MSRRKSVTYVSPPCLLPVGLDRSPNVPTMLVAPVCDRRLVMLRAINPPVCLVGRALRPPKIGRACWRG
jgi:hypothetical protein